MANDGARPNPGETVAERGDTPSRAGAEAGAKPFGGVGDVVGSYRLEALLGSGGMGRVYRARHVRLGREVALKLLLPQHVEDRVAVTRFFNEAHAVNAINHEHIVQIFDCVEEPPPSSRVYCILELLEGKTLSQALKEGPLPLARGVEIVRQVCEALAAAHKCGVVHRDVKPANIFLTQRADGSDFVKMLDFGVAKILKPLGGDRDELATQAGIAIGTPEYMSPEQALSKPVDERSDIYAVGLVLYELLSGRRPFDPGSLAQLLVALVTEPPKPLSGRNATGEAIPPILADLVMRCLRKNPDERPKSMEQVCAALVAASQPVRARSPELADTKVDVRSRPPKAGFRKAWLALPMVLLALGAGVVVLRHRPAPAKVASAPPPRAVVAGAPLPVLAPTKPAPVKRTLTLQSRPPGATVLRVDTHETLGTSPLKLTLLDGQSATLQFEKAGYVSARRTVVAHADDVVEEVLSPVPAAPHHRAGTRKEHPLERDGLLDPFASH